MFNTILVANTAEAFKGVLLKDKDTKVGAERIKHELTLSQRAFFWESDDKMVVTPHLIPLPLFELNKRICGFKNVVNVAPSVGDIELSNAIAKDKQVRSLIAKEARGNLQLTMSPYAITRDFLEMSGQFSVQTKERPPNKSLWTVAYLDSKAGFRAEMLKLASEYKEIKVPQGFVAQDATEALLMAEWFYENDQSSILKANFGESGWGIAILRVESYSSLSVFRKQVRTILQSDVIWQDTSIVVEQFIETDASVAGGSPSTEVFVGEEGISLLYHCGQLLNDFGGFLGAESMLLKPTHGEQVALIPTTWQDIFLATNGKMRHIFCLTAHSVTLISEWNPVMGYIVIASNSDEGRELQKRLFGLFKK